MSKRTPFPPVFWVANLVEVLERFAYYGIYFGFGIYMESLGYSKGELGIIQSVFLAISYITPVISGTFADRFGFKKVLVISYLAYLPSILLLILTKSFSGIALTMLSIGFAAGVFKPLISGTVRAVTDKFGPIVAGKLRAISWDYAFYAAAASIFLMLIITLLFYKEPERKIEGVTLGRKFKDIGVALSDLKFSAFLVLLGLFFWLPFWAFFNLCAIYVDRNIDTAELYQAIRGVFGAGFADFFSHEEEGTRRVLGETISHTGYIIMIFQIFISRIFEKTRALSTFLLGLLISAAGFAVLGLALDSYASLVFLGIFLFAVGEMISSPRIQEYITWIAPKEKAGLYMGANFLAVGLGGGTSGLYTWLYGVFRDMDQPDYIWYTLGAHLLIGIMVLWGFTRVMGEFKERDE